METQENYSSFILTRSLLLWFLSKLAHWKLDNELTENHDDPDPEDLIDAIDWRLALDLTDLPDIWLEEDAAAIKAISKTVPFDI